MYKINIFLIHFFVILCFFFQSPGRKTACTFYQTRGMEEDKYETTKLPAPENEIYMNNYDIAVLMQKNSKGIWKTKNYYYVKQQFSIKPGDWIIVVTDDGVVKQYRYFFFFFIWSLRQYSHKENTKKIISNKQFTIKINFIFETNV